MTEFSQLSFLAQQMLNIKTIRVLSKVQGLFDKINTPEVVVKIVIDDYFVLPQIKGATVTHETVWNEGQVPFIQLSSYQSQYKLQFAVYREGLLIGTATTLLKYGQVLKQQNDVIDQTNTITGKILYQCSWQQSVRGDYVTYQQFVAFKEKNKASGGNLGAITIATKREQVRTYVKRQEDEDCGCGCFGGGKKRPQPVQSREVPREKPQEIIIKNQQNQDKMKDTKVAKSIKDLQENRLTPYLYLQSELQQGSPRPNQAPLKLVYYSKEHFISK